MLASNSLRGDLRFDEPMAGHTSWRVGGPADLFFQPADLADVEAFLGRYLNGDQDLVWVGLGSNVLVRDGGIRGAVICTAKVLNDIQLLDEQTIWAEAGLSCAKLARFCAAHNLSGGEFFTGIPGTLGGALAMNAGAWGGETWDWVVEVETIDRAGIRRMRDKSAFEIGYRSVVLPAQEWFVGARLRLEKGHQTEIRARMRKLLEQRNTAQPLQLASAGSVFRNPPGDHAARLIEVCGLKGFSIGGAEISSKHANFIINRGEATAANIEALISHIQRTVLQQYNVTLVTEVCILGEAQ